MVAERARLRIVGPDYEPEPWSAWLDPAAYADLFAAALSAQELLQDFLEGRSVDLSSAQRRLHYVCWRAVRCPEGDHAG